MFSQCEEATRLLGVYKESLALVDRLTGIASPKEKTAATPQEIQGSRVHLLRARERYWNHVQKYRCRKAEAD